MYECESWTIKKAACRRIDAFEVWCRRRFLRVPWTAGRSNQSVLKNVIPEYSMKGLMLKLQHSGHLIGTADSIGKDGGPGKDWGQKEKRVTENEIVGWHHQLSGHEFEQTLRNSEGQGSLECCSPWGRKVTEQPPPPYCQVMALS